MKLALSLALAVGLSVLGSYAFPHFSPLAIIDSALAPDSLSTPVPIAAPSAVASAFTPGNLVVYRVGDGTSALGPAATPVFLDEYTASGAFVQSIALPTTISGSNRRLTGSGTATSEGMISRSADGRYILVTGYDAAVGTDSVTGTTSSSTNRVVGRVDSGGTVDTTTALSDAFTSSNIKGATSVDGTGFWVIGGAGGVRYSPLGNTTSTQISTSPSNLRGVGVFGSQLYISANTGSIRLASVGTGLSTNTGNTATNLPGFPTSNYDPNGFVFFDLDANVTGIDTLYVADELSDRIAKYSLVAGSWLANGIVAATNPRGLAGYANGSSVSLFATLDGSTLRTVTDTSGYNATMVGSVTTLVTAGANKAFRGVALSPVQPTAPSIQISGGPLNFGNQEVNTTSGLLSVTVTNTGSANLVLATPTFVTGSQFAFTSNPNTTVVEPGNSTTLSFTFTPTSTGVKSDTVTVNSNASGPAPTFALSGTGIAAAPEISADPMEMMFGVQAVGTTSGTRSVTISNSGTGNLNIGQLIKGGSNASEFSITSDPSNTVVAPGGTAKVRVTFTPAGDAGSRTATITVPSNDSDEANTVVTLSGIAIAATTPSPVKSMWVWDGDPVTNLGERNRMVARAVASGITDIYISVYQSGGNTQGRLMYESADIAAVAVRAHAEGIRVWAAYGDPAWQDQPCSNGQSAYERMQEVVAFNAERPADQGFDGVMLDVEPGAAFNLTNFANMHNCFRGILPSNIKLGTAISAFWHAPSRAAVEYPAGGELKSPAEHIIDLPLDQVVVMGYRDNAGSTGGNGIIGLDETEIAYATSIGKAGLVLAGLETKDLGDPPNEHVTFFEEGQAILDSESASVASHFSSSAGFGGFSIHAYFDEYLGGAAIWPDSIAAPAAATAEATTVAGTSATLNGLANPKGLATVGYFYYGTDNSGGCLALGTRAPAAGGADLGSGTGELPFSQAISGLTPSTTYYFCAVAESAAGMTIGSVFQLTTSSPPSQLATADATNVTAVAATLNGFGNPNGDAAVGYFRYGTADPIACTDSFGTRSPSSGGADLGPGATQVTFSQAVSGLSPATTYYFCAFAQNSAGISVGSKFSFTTAGLPDAVTATATSINSTSATLNGFGTPNGASTIVYFRYGTTDPGTCDNTFGTRAPVSGGIDLGSGTSQIAFSQAISGLTPNTTYYICAAAENDGGTDFGAVLSFKTGGRNIVVERIIDDPSVNECTDADLDCSLRGALMIAEGGDTISFSPSQFSFGSRTLFVEYSAPLLIEDNVTIIGPGADLLTLRGGSYGYPIFEVASGLDSVSISGLRLIMGSGGSQAGGIHIGNSNVSLDRIWISDTHKAIYTEGTLAITNSAISGNYAAPGNGAGVHNAGGTLTIINSTVSGNQSYGSGSKGAGIYSLGGTVNLTSATITGNTAEIGSGVTIESGSANIRNTVIAANTNNGAIPDISGAFTSSGFNVIGNGTGASGFAHGVNGDQVGPLEDGSIALSPNALVPIDPKLGPLGNNGGTTPTHSPLLGSPLIDKGFSFGSAADQRGMPRPQDLGNNPNAVGGDGSDVGAYEMLAPTAATASISGRVTTARGIAIRDVRITVQGIDGSMRRAETNSFGYYRVAGLEAGSSYIVSVSARRHTFATASVMVNLSDNVDGLNFRASP